MPRLNTISTEARSQPTSWDLLKLGDVPTDGGTYVSAYFAENLSVVFACTQAIAESCAMLPLRVYRKMPDGSRLEEPAHPVARLFSGDPTPSQADIKLTRELVEAGRHMKVAVHDHVIVGTQGQSSLRAMGLM